MEPGNKARTIDKVKSLASVTIAGVVIAIAFVLLAFGINTVALTKALILAVFISFISGYFELFVFPQSLKKLSFIASLAIKTIFYVLVISVPALLLWIIHESMVNHAGVMETMSSSDFRHFLFEGDFPVILTFSLAAGFLINFIVQLSLLIGRNVFVNYLTGKYHKPVEEVRTFMFLDLVSSTSIAEKLNPVAYHSFMSRCFYDIDGPIVESIGEIYQYAGDEVIISWKEGAAFRRNNCIECFFRIKSELQKLNGYYMSEFGVVPEFRAGVHTGMVVTGEIGDSKREIVFHGDVLNTASRIQGVSKELKKDIVISKDVADKLENKDAIELEQLGEFQLKGKSVETLLYCVRKK